MNSGLFKLQNERGILPLNLFFDKLIYITFLLYVPKLGSMEEKLLFEQSNRTRSDGVDGTGMLPWSSLKLRSRSIKCVIWTKGSFSKVVNMLCERSKLSRRFSHIQLGMTPSIWLFEKSISWIVSIYFNDARNFVRLQDARYKFWILREWENIVSPSFSVTDIILLPRLRYVRFLNLQIEPSSIVSVSLFEPRRRCWRFISSKNDLGIGPVNWLLFKSISHNGEDKGAGMSSGEPTSWLSLRRRFCRTGRANKDFGIFHACNGRIPVRMLQTLLMPFHTEAPIRTWNNLVSQSIGAKYSSVYHLFQSR